MKRRITLEQLHDLTPEQLKKLNSLWQPEIGDHFSTPFSLTGTVERIEGSRLQRTIDVALCQSWPVVNCLPLLDIGQMIELLENSLEDARHYCEIRWCKHEELCDVLWQMTKEVLARM